jgi:hypothetical protein
MKQTNIERRCRYRPHAAEKLRIQPVLVAFFRIGRSVHCLLPERSPNIGIVKHEAVCTPVEVWREQKREKKK